MNKMRGAGVSDWSRGRRFATALTAATLAVAVATACSDAAHAEDRPAPADQAKAAAINGKRRRHHSARHPSTPAA